MTRHYADATEHQNGASITAGSLTLTVGALLQGHGLSGLVAPYTVRVCKADGTNAEEMDVTAVGSYPTVTVTRGVNTTTAVSHDTTEIITQVVGVNDLDNVVQKDQDAATTTTGLVETDRTAATTHPVARIRQDLPLGSSNAAAQPLDPPADVSLIERLRCGSQVFGLFADTSSYEFDLQFYNGVYYFAHDDHSTQTILTHASTVAGLSGASTDAVVPVRYPSLLFDGTTWHVWGSILSTTWQMKHYTSSTFGGTYTLADTTNLDTFDVQVRRSPIDGNYYCAYGRYLASEVVPANVGILKASSPGGPWTDLGYIFSVSGNPSYAPNQFDPTPIFWNGRAYVVFAGNDGGAGPNRICMVELDPSTMKVIGTPTVLVDSLETTGTGDYLGNPIWLAHPSQPGQERLYFDGLTGFSALQVGPPMPDGRRPSDGLRLNAAVGLDVASGLQATTHGGATWGANGLVCAATPSGAYGQLNRTSLADFTLAIEFSLTSMPGADALLLRASRSALGSNEAALWVTNAGVLKGKVIGSTTLTLTGTTTLVAGTVYRATLRRFGSEVRLFLGTHQEASGTQADALTTLTEWSVANDKGATQAAGEQALATIYGAVVCGEALQLSADPLSGLSTGSALTLATQTANTVFAGPTTGAAAAPTFRGLAAADIPDLSATYALAGTAGTRWELLMTDGVTNPPVPITTEDGTDWLYYG